MNQTKLIEEIIELVKNASCSRVVLTTYDRDMALSVKEAIIRDIKRKYQDGK